MTCGDNCQVLWGRPTQHMWRQLSGHVEEATLHQAWCLAWGVRCYTSVSPKGHYVVCSTGLLILAIRWPHRPNGSTARKMKINGHALG